MMEIFEQYGLKSCYHTLNQEEYGNESKATHYYHGKVDRPFHIDYCFVSHNVLQGIDHLAIGGMEEYVPLSDHVPLVLEFSLC